MTGLLLALGSAGFWVIAWQAGVRMRPSLQALGRPGIVGLQFARTAAAVTRLTQRWGVAGIAAARENTRWDFLLILGYTGGLSLLGLVLHEPTAVVFGWDPRALAVVVVAVPVVAGLCDVAENLLTLRMLERGPTDALAAATSRLALVKWAGLCLTLAWTVLVALPIAIVRL